MYIQKVQIKNIRSIENLTLEFPEPAGWHVLIGDNGSGKSTILKALALTIIGPKESLALRLNFDDFISKGKQEGWVEIEVQRHESDSYSGNARPLTRPFKAGISLLRQQNGLSSSSGGQIKEKASYRYAQKHIWSSRSGWFATSFGPFRRFSGGNKDWEKVYYSNPRAASHLSVFGEDVALTESLEWLISLKYKSLEKDEEATLTLLRLKRFINEGALLPHGAKIKEVSSEGVAIEDGYGQTISVQEMSDGFRSILSLTFELIRQMVRIYGVRAVLKDRSSGSIEVDIPGIVMIDEIDAHLHPTWQTRIGQWFLKHFPRIQFIVTTHSPLICRAAEHGSIWRLSGPDKDFRTYRLENTERDRLIYGNVLEALGTEVFGSHIVRSESSQEKLERMAKLNIKSIRGQISETEKEELQQLKAILPTGK